MPISHALSPRRWFVRDRYAGHSRDRRRSLGRVSSPDHAVGPISQQKSNSKGGPMKVRRMLGRRGRSISAVVVALGLLAAACGDSGGKSTSPTQTGSTGTATGSATTAAAKPTPGGELRYLLPIESPSMDPCAWTFSGQGTNALRAIPVYDSLIRLNNATGEYSYQIAESLKPSADFKTWTLKIKSGVLFSDGTTFDAAAVKYNWERLGDPALKCQMAGQVAGIDSMTVVDPLTLSVVLKDASSSFPDVVSSRIGVIGSPTAMKSLGADFGSKPVGAGPFVVESWVKDDKMVLVKNPKYYQASKGLPYLDKITIRPLLDENQRRASLEKGEADLIFTQIPTTIAPLEANKNVNVTKYSLQGAENMLFNVTTAPFKDVRARKAFIQSVDTKKLAEIVFANGLPPA
ncbi:MAG: ABC transporter substrate-binding protein, partial [Actinobacteria bacterium]